MAITLVFSFGADNATRRNRHVRGWTSPSSELLPVRRAVARRPPLAECSPSRAAIADRILGRLRPRPRRFGVRFIGSIYLALLTSAPAELREPTQSAVVGIVYSLPPIAGVVPPMLATLGIYLTHRLLK